METDRRTVGPTVIALAVIVAVGTIIRAFGVARADFPLNDGGLFFQMVLDLQRTWPALPETTSYNAIGAPFAYPPLGFYLGAVLEPWLGTDVLRVVPVIASALSVPFFYLLARSVLASPSTALFATIAFTVMPRTYEWMTMGGGLTRAPGILLSLIALWLTMRVVRGAGWGAAAGAGVAGGLVVLTHPQAALFTLTSGLLLVAWFVRDRATAVRLAIALGVAVGVALPWLVTVVGRDGLSAILSAGGTQPGPLVGLLSVLSLSISGSQLFDVVGLLIGIGFVISILRRRWLLPAWVVLVLILDARGGATYASVPAAMLAGQAFSDLFVRPIWRRDAGPESATPANRLPRLAPVTAVLGAVLVAVALIDAFGSQASPDWPGVALTAVQRGAIQEAGQTAPDGDVLVVSGRPWAMDATAEWFPVLGHARSVGTVQGHEWLPGDDFMRRARAAEALRDCATSGPDCLDAWSEEWDLPFTHVFIPKGPLSGPFGDTECCEGLRLLLAADDRYELTLDDAGGALFARK